MTVLQTTPCVDSLFEVSESLCRPDREWLIAKLLHTAGIQRAQFVYPQLHHPGDALVHTDTGLTL